MKYKITKPHLLLLKSSVWILYVFYCILIINVQPDLNVINGVLLSAVTVELSVNRLLNNWYSHGKPRLVDWFNLFSFIYLVLNFFSIAWERNVFYFISDRFILEEKHIISSIVIIILGMASLQLGSWLMFNAVSNHRPLRNQERYTLVRSHLFYGFAVLISFIQLFLMVNGVLGYGTLQEHTTSSYSFLIATIQILGPFILTVFSVLSFIYNYKERWFNTVFVAFIGLQLIFGFLSGMKETILTPIIIILIPYLKAGLTISKKYIILGVFSILILYPLNNNFRGILNEYPNLDRQTAFFVAAKETFDISLVENVNSGSESFSSRLSLFPFLVYAVQYEDSWTYYKNLNRYIYLPVAWFVPRLFIPDKPKSETGAVLNNMIYGYSTNSLTTSTFGWAYFEGGYIYVFILFLFFGAFLGFIDLKSDSNMFSYLIYVIALISCLTIETDIYFRVSSLLQTAFIYYLFYKIFIIKLTHE